MQNPRPINMNLVDAQQARRILDRIVGYKTSRVLNIKIKKGLSGGRVQSAVLKMVIDREREINNFKPEEYWILKAILQKPQDSLKFNALFVDKNGKKYKVDNQEKAEGIENAIKDSNFIVDNVKRSVSHSHPNPPFTTSTLQQDGSNRLQLTAPEVMKIAQQLYEGINIEGMGLTALVTYIRTDSVRVSEEAQFAAKNYITNTYGPKFVPSKPNIYTTKAANVQDAHEAIRPINLAITPASIENKVNKNQFKLYQLIYNRFLASQMADAEYNTLNVHITAKGNDNNEYGFKVSGKALKFQGFTAVYALEVKKDDENDEDQKLPNFEGNESLDYKGFKKDQKFTKPPQRFTDGTLTKAMEDNGVGRPATYANIISVLNNRKYVTKDGKYMKPTELGESVNDFMEKNMPNIVDTKFTASMETQLDEVSNGLQWQKVISDFYPTFMQTLHNAYNDGENQKVKAQETDVICDKCGSKMVVRESKFGKFLACPNYPRCKNIKPFETNEIDATCPSCGGKIVTRKTKSGKVFYGCNNYPTCQFSSWDIPAPIFCPDCNSVMKIWKKDDKIRYYCLNKDCKNIVEVVDGKIEKYVPKTKTPTKQ